MIDLHCHSYYSDGQHSPEFILERALKNGIRLLALTDHDSLDSCAVLAKAAEPFATEIRVLTGVELSARWKKYDIHILGLDLDIENPRLQAGIAQQKANRRTRAMAIAAALEQVTGLTSVYEQALALSQKEQLGRPHFARLLVEAGLAKDMQAAFKRYLVRGKPAYVPSAWLGYQEVVELILAAGGRAVIAHPLKYGLTRTKLRELILEFKDSGGQAIEVVSGQTTEQEARDLAELARHFQLLASSGSDFHADGLSYVDLGRQRSLPETAVPLWQDWMA